MSDIKPEGWSVPIQRLIDSDETLPDPLHSELVAAEAGIAAELMALIEAELAGQPEGDGWPAIHAATLLGERGEAQAVPLLLRCLAECDVLDVLYDRAREALAAVGPAALDACLAAYPQADDTLRDDLALVLSRLSVQDLRVLAILTETLERSPTIGANALFHYGDPQALPLLGQAFDAFTPKDPASPFAYQDLIELRAAIQDLGGKLTAAQAEKFAQMMGEREQVAERLLGGRCPGRRRHPRRRRLSAPVPNGDVMSRAGAVAARSTRNATGRRNRRDGRRADRR